MQHTIVPGPFQPQSRYPSFSCRWEQIKHLLQSKLHRAGCRPLRNSSSLPPLALLAAQPSATLPHFVTSSPLAMKYLNLLGKLDWERFPHRSPARAFPGPEPQSPLPYVIALLMRIDQRQQSMGALVDLLCQHPELAWLAGFAAPMDAASYSPSVAAAAVPSAARFSQFLRRLPNQSLQSLVEQTVHLLSSALPAHVDFGNAVSFDTKHIIAWVKENNPKAHIAADRFDKDKQPAGDSDCKLGCKRRTNKGSGKLPLPALPTRTTPAAEGKPAQHLGSGIGEFYWGYASAIAVTKVPVWGEFILAELTATFDHPDVGYFFPLMQQVEQHLGRKPRFGTADAAFDAHYIYDYFHQAGGFAAIPSRLGNDPPRSYTPDGVLLCEAGLPMSFKMRYHHRTSLVAHDRNRWACPLLYPQPTGLTCPIQHARWLKGGCCITVAASDGARIRHQLDRHSDEYQALYNQRTACERIFSQAVTLGIEHPKLRNQCSIANLNTLIYVLINLRSLQRVLDLAAQLNSD
jgi:hypothetical protein